MAESFKDCTAVRIIKYTLYGINTLFMLLCTVYDFSFGSSLAALIFYIPFVLINSFLIFTLGTLTLVDELFLIFYPFINFITFLFEPARTAYLIAMIVYIINLARLRYNGVLKTFFIIICVVIMAPAWLSACSRAENMKKIDYFNKSGTKALTYNYYDAGSAKEFVGLQYKFKIAGELYILSDTEPADQKQNASPKEIHWLDDDTAVIDDMKIKVKFTYPKILTES